MQSTGKDEVSDRVAPPRRHRLLLALPALGVRAAGLAARSRAPRRRRPGPYAQRADGPRARARAPPPDPLPATTSTSASCRSPSAPSGPRELVAEGERVIYQGALRAETTLAGTEVEIVGVPDFLLPARSRLCDPRLEARPPDRRPLPRDRAPARHLRLAVRADLRRAAGRAPGPQRRRRDRRHPLRGRRRGARDPGADPPRPARRRRAPRAGRDGQVRGAAGSSSAAGHPRSSAARSACCRGRGGLAGELERRGVETIDQLLERYDADSLAEVERPWGKGMKKVGEQAAARILAGARALAEDRPIVLQPPAIPEHPNYVMFDLEGMPPQLDELEKIYLWGMQVFGERPGEFRAATAGFGPRGDREGWEAFLAEAAAIFAEHGDIPFVHWASYERAKINLYLDRYGDRDGIAARVKRQPPRPAPDHLRVRRPPPLQLQPQGRRGRSPATSASSRSTAATGRWRATSRRPRPRTRRCGRRSWTQILAYNREDLEATWAVMQWLISGGVGATSGL